MKKRPLTLLLLFLFLSVTLAGIPSVSADLGPKPLTWITIRGLTEPYDFDLLVEYEPEDPDIVTIDLENSDNGIYYSYYYQDTYPIDALNGYQDADGYASYTLYFGGIPHNIFEEESEVPGERVFRIGYFRPPTVFKIAIWTASGTLVVSRVIETTLFYSHVTYDLTTDAISLEGEDAEPWNEPYGIEAGFIEEDVPVWTMIGNFALRLVLTILLEGAVLFAFGYRGKKSFLLLLWVNLATQTLLLGAMLAGNYFWGGTMGAWLILTLAEIPVFGVEILLYARKLTEKTRGRAVLYAVGANLLSFALSFWSVIWLL